MALRYKVDVIQLLKDSGYSTYTIRKEKLIIENMLQKLRNKEMVSWTTLNTVLRKCTTIQRRVRISGNSLKPTAPVLLWEKVNVLSKCQ